MEENNLQSFVKERRKRLGLTQEELSFKAGVGLRFVRDLEQGKSSLQMNKVNQVLKLFGYELGAVPANREDLLHEEG
ncbi:helix-turn-helix transcriptional regulator [Rufibacter sp. XAAS-G3-1]|uniref:helix-turn-helix transcriptional regulator n=1 Tax=Rufibacter sp. XAAS-G3-1 TaxID=2729134 RepID=UPI0015E6D089|nr:helix-turn-helix transcriptional regulator [Rufibacter sp. XAAS-G3-1]